MAEEIDRLVVSLGLDPSDFIEGGKEAVDALQNLTDEQALSMLLGYG